MEGEVFKIPTNASSKPRPQTQKLSYAPPEWSGSCQEPYSVEIIKSGSIVDELNLINEEYVVFGREPPSRIVMQHPSISRHHAVLQYCPKDTERHRKGWHIYDLDSTHGTSLNKRKIDGRTFIRLRVGHVIKFGGSTRLHILKGPDEDKEDELPMPVKKPNPVDEDDGNCLWGIGKDEIEEEDESDKTNPFSLETHEHLYQDDPKKALKHYFDREGLDFPDVEASEAGFNKYRCRMELPDGLHAEVTVSGRKKEAQHQCMIEACRILDRLGELTKTTNIERRKTQKKIWEENDYYDSDDDEFLDRTGDIEKKRINRMKIASVVKDKVLTHDEILAKLKEKRERIDELEEILKKAKEDSEKLSKIGMDALEDYMESLKQGKLEASTKQSYRREIIELKKEIVQLERLENKARPCKNFPKLYNKYFGSMKAKQNTVKAVQLPKPVTEEVSLPEKNKNKSNEDETEDFLPNLEQKQVEITPESPEQSIPDSTTDVLKIQTEKKQRKEENMDESPSSTTNTTSLMKSKELIELEKKKEVQENESLKKSKQISKESSEIEEVNQAENEAECKSNEQPEETKKEVKKPKKKAQKRKFFSKDYCEDDPSYTTWMPPVNQSGDGKTSLNEKLGY